MGQDGIWRPYLDNRAKSCILWQLAGVNSMHSSSIRSFLRFRATWDIFFLLKIMNVLMCSDKKSHRLFRSCCIELFRGSLMWMSWGICEWSSNCLNDGILASFIVYTSIDADWLLLCCCSDNERLTPAEIEKYQYIVWGTYAKQYAVITLAYFSMCKVFIFNFKIKDENTHWMNEAFINWLQISLNVPTI